MASFGITMRAAGAQDEVLSGNAGAGVAFAIRCCMVLGMWLVLGLPAVAQNAKTGGHTYRADPRASLPARKAGLWEVTVHAHAPRGMGGMRQPSQTVRQCTDASAERVMLLSIQPGQENCSEFKVVKRAGPGGYDISGVCSVHGQRVIARTQLRGDLRSVYSGTYSVQYPEAPMASIGPVAFQARWLGSCKAGLRPGDMVLPNGARVNVVDDVGRAEKHAH